MAKDTIHHKQSKLSAFPISFEYDMTLPDIKRALKKRTHK